jgi:tetratricopeptide (TPR) repeat protein
MRWTLVLLLAMPALHADPKIESLMECGHWKRARAAAEAALKANPNDARAAYDMARVRQRYGDLDDGIKYAELAIKLDPNLAPAHRILGELYGDKALKASFLKQIGLAGKIKSSFEKAAALDPKDPENLADLISYYLEAPGIAGGDKKKASELAQQLVKLNPSRGYLEMARIAQHEKHPEELGKFYELAVEANPKDYNAQLTLSNYYFNPPHQDVERAAKHAHAVLDLDPDRTAGYKLVGIALVMQHKYEDAGALLARAESAVPDDFSPYIVVARALLRENAELPRAEGYLKRYLERTQEPEAGTPPLAGGHWSLGLVYEKMGRKADAISEMQTALKLKSDFEPARKDLKRLQGS